MEAMRTRREETDIEIGQVGRDQTGGVATVGVLGVVMC